MHGRSRSKTDRCMKEAQDLCSQKNGKFALCLQQARKKNNGYNKGSLGIFSWLIFSVFPFVVFLFVHSRQYWQFSARLVFLALNLYPSFIIGHRRLIDPRANRRLLFLCVEDSVSGRLGLSNGLDPKLFCVLPGRIVFKYALWWCTIVLEWITFPWCMNKGPGRPKSHVRKY